MSAGPRVGGVVVTFHPDAGFETRLAAMLDEVRPVIVIDNTATPATRNRLHAACTRLGAELIENDENVGLGAALNRAFRVLDERGFAAVIAFDQDSTPEPGLAAALVSLMAADPRLARSSVPTGTTKPGPRLAPATCVRMRLCPGVSRASQRRTTSTTSRA
jgi:GT2 family glycosyltransferase